MELFATFDEQGEPLGLVPRDDVHRTGAWHKSAQVFVFDAASRLLIQQRVPHKDLYANLWDYSVGEHLQPGESYLAGALRGLAEELGIVGVELDALGGERRVQHSGEDFDDREMQQAYRGVWDGPLRLDSREVAQVRYIALHDLKPWMTARPAEFTPWFGKDLNEFGLLD